MARIEDSHPSPTTTPTPGGSLPPEVGRPRGAAWKALQQEGIEVESQVQIVGDENDLAARLILTGKRLALISGGQIIVEFPRTWLRPQAKLLAENGVRIFITPEGADIEAVGEGSSTERITLRAREGRGAAASLVSTMTGRAVAPTVSGAPRASLPPASQIAATTTPAPRNHGQRTGSALPLEVPTWRSSIAGNADQRPVASSTPVTPGPEAAILATNGSDDQPLATRVTPNWATNASGNRSRADRQPIATRTQAADGTSGSIAAWTAQNLDQRPSSSYGQPSPVPASVSRAARQQATGSDGRTVREDALPVVTRPQQSVGHRTAVWALRAAIMLLFLGGATFLGRDYLRDQIVQHDIPLPAAIDAEFGIARDGNDTPNGTDVGQVNAPNTNGSTGDVVLTVTPTTAGGDNVKDDLGGTNGPVPTASVTGPDTTVVTEEAAAPTQAPVETVVATEAPVETTAPVETVAPTDEPVVETAIPTDEPVETAVPTDEPVETAAPTETAAETEAPTETVEPTATETATAEPTATTAPTEGPSPTPTLEPQPASVDPETTPAQQVAADGFRFTVEGASFGEAVPELPEINPATRYGNWLVLRVNAQNTSTENQVFDMSQFTVYADGEPLQLDEGNAWVSGLLGMTPAYGPTDAILWAPGESHDIALTFLAPQGTQSLVLQVGNQTMDLSGSLNNPGTLMAQDGAASAVPDYIEAKVVEVVNGETIVVEIDGVRQSVRYLGIEAPTQDDCFSAEATQANAALVEGQTVRIERQATNVDPRGNWVRDVWAPTQDGRFELVAASLVNEGAAKARISEPNTRFSGWLMSGEAAAKAQGLGLWSSAACGTGAAGTTDATNATVPSPEQNSQPTIAPVSVIPATRQGSW